MKVVIPGNIFSYVAGAIVAVAWFLLIDAQVYVDYILKAPRNSEMTFLNWLPAIISFFGAVFLNVVPTENLILQSDEDHDKRVVWFARGWVFVSTLLLFGSGIAGVVIMVVDLTNPAKLYVYGKIVTLIHPLLVIISSFVFFFGRMFGDKLRFGESESF